MKTVAHKTIKRKTLAEQLADSIKALILSNQLPPGASLPTEPELAQQFGVSRAVVRDGTRILMAWGLVDVQHGRGMFVTESQHEAFNEALLLALQRTGATVWDVEQFGQILLPEVVALAAEQASDAEIDQIRQAIDTYLTAFEQHVTSWWQRPSPPEALEALRATVEPIQEALFAATHNRLFQQLARPLARLRNLRHWQDAPESTPETTVAQEKAYHQKLLAAIATKNPHEARAITKTLVQLPPEAIASMQQTLVGEIPKIPVSLPPPD